MSLSPLILEANESAWAYLKQEEPEGILYPPQQRPCEQCSKICLKASPEGHYCEECWMKFKFCDYCTDRHSPQHPWTVKVTHIEQLLCKGCDQHTGMTDTFLFASNTTQKPIFCGRCKNWKANNILGCGTLLCNECYVIEATNTLLQKEVVLLQLEEKMRALRELAREFAKENAQLKQKNRALKQEKNKSVFDQLAITEFKSEHVESFEMYEPAILPANNAN